MRRVMSRTQYWHQWSGSRVVSAGTTTTTTTSSPRSSSSTSSGHSSLLLCSRWCSTAGSGHCSESDSNQWQSDVFLQQNTGSETNWQVSGPGWISPDQLGWDPGVTCSAQAWETFIVSDLTWTEQRSKDLQRSKGLLNLASRISDLWINLEQ